MVLKAKRFLVEAIKREGRLLWGTGILLLFYCLSFSARAQETLHFDRIDMGGVKLTNINLTSVPGTTEYQGTYDGLIPSLGVDWYGGIVTYNTELSMVRKFAFVDSDRPTFTPLKPYWDVAYADLYYYCDFPTNPYYNDQECNNSINPPYCYTVKKAVNDNFIPHMQGSMRIFIANGLYAPGNIVVDLESSTDLENFNFTMTGKPYLFNTESADSVSWDFRSKERRFETSAHFAFLDRYDAVASITFDESSGLKGTMTGTVNLQDSIIDEVSSFPANAVMNKDGFTGEFLLKTVDVQTFTLVPPAPVCTPFGCVYPVPIPKTEHVDFRYTFAMRDGIWSLVRNRANDALNASSMAASDKETTEFNPLNNWRTIDAIPAQNSHSGIAPLGLPVTQLSMPEDALAAMFLIEWSNPGVDEIDATLTTPNGEEFILSEGYLPTGYDSLDAFSLFNSGSNSAFFALYRPDAGEYTVTINNEAALGDFTVELLSMTHPPSIEIQSVLETAETGIYQLNWVDEDEDSNAVITISLDNDRKGDNGHTIASSIEEDDDLNSYTIDTNTLDLTPGYYYVVMKIDDGDNMPQLRYSQTPIHVSNPKSPSSVEQISAWEGDGEFALQWERVDDPSIHNYLVKASFFDGYRNWRTLTQTTPDDNRIHFSDVQNGFPVILTVTAVNQEGYESEPVTSVRVVPHSIEGFTQPVITSKPSTLATAEQLYIYHPIVFDADFHHYYQRCNNDDAEFEWSLIQAPEGMEIFETGTIVWTPTQEQVGEHTVKLQIVDRKAANGNDALEPVAQEYSIAVYSPQMMQGVPDCYYRFLTHPTVSVKDESVYSYQIYIFADPATIQYELMEGPEDMAITPEGLVLWDVPKNSKGSPVRIKAIVEDLYEIEQDFYLHVFTDANTNENSSAKGWETIKD